ncbi:MAG: MotA/TolQ/ExbB proton channel family protein [Kiritimatiellia bacterium]
MKMTPLQKTMAFPLLGFAVLILCSPLTAFAQGETISVAQPPDQTTLWGLFKMGGWSMYVLLGGSVAAVGLTIYNGIALQTKKFLRPDIFQKLKGYLEVNDFNGAKDYCENEKAPLANIVHAGLDRVAGFYLDIESVEKGMEEAAMEEVTGNLIPINYLSVIAVIAPMVGLLGTVSGMIKAFGNMASQGMGRPEVLADNISEALITTAGGLLVGIPVMIIYFYFKNRYTGLISALNRMSGEVLEKINQAAHRLQEEATGE